MELVASEYENLIELTSDNALKIKFAEVPISFLGKVLKKFDYLKKNTSTIIVCVDLLVQLKFFYIYANEIQALRQIGRYTRYKNSTVKY